MKPIALSSPIDRVVAEYHAHLINNAGLTPATCKAWIFYVRRFLSAQFKPKAPTLDWERLNAPSLLNYLCAQHAQYALPRLQCLASALRSFCRFLCVTGRCASDWSAAIPQVASQGRAELPDYLSESQLEQLVRHAAGQGPTAQRDHAILLCLSRLGLRAGEVARLRLEDLDWRAGTLRLSQTKGRRERLLPLLPEVERALATYLRHGRPKTPSRAVFVSQRDGGFLTSNAVSALAVAAFKRARVTTVRPGAHRLRHTLASHLVQRGVSLKAVADLLGHRCLSTTQVYAKVNLPLLREVPLAWPREVPS